MHKGTLRHLIIYLGWCTEPTRLLEGCDSWPTLRRELDPAVAFFSRTVLKNNYTRKWTRYIEGQRGNECDKEKQRWSSVSYNYYVRTINLFWTVSTIFETPTLSQVLSTFIVVRYQIQGALGRNTDSTCFLVSIGWLNLIRPVNGVLQQDFVIV